MVQGLEWVPGSQHSEWTAATAVGPRPCHFLASVPTYLQTFPGVELWFQTRCESSELPAPHRSGVHGSNVTLGSI